MNNKKKKTKKIINETVIIIVLNCKNFCSLQNLYNYLIVFCFIKSPAANRDILNRKRSFVLSRDNTTLCFLSIDKWEKNLFGRLTANFRFPCARYSLVLRHSLIKTEKFRFELAVKKWWNETRAKIRESNVRIPAWGEDGVIAVCVSEKEIERVWYHMCKTESTCGFRLNSTKNVMTWDGIRRGWMWGVWW